MILHSFMTLAKPRDPPRVLSVQQYDKFVESNMHQQPVVATTPDEANIDVHHPGHVVVIYFFWYFVFVVLFFILLLTLVMFFFSLTRMVM